MKTLSMFAQKLLAYGGGMILHELSPGSMRMVKLYRITFLHQKVEGSVSIYKTVHLRRIRGNKREMKMSVDMNEIESTNELLGTKIIAKMISGIPLEKITPKETTHLP